MISPLFSLIAITLLGFSSIANAQETAPTFRWQGEGLRLETSALSRDQVLGFFMGRGFDLKTATFFADEGCVFRSAIGRQKDSDPTRSVSIDLSQWRVHLQGKDVQGKKHAMRMRKQWDVIWDRMDVDESARVGFKWALFPPQQTFGPNDYNWGMLTFAQPPGTKFDLEIVWTFGGEIKKHRIEGLKCTP